MITFEGHHTNKLCWLRILPALKRFDAQKTTEPSWVCLRRREVGRLHFSVVSSDLPSDSMTTRVKQRIEKQNSSSKGTGRSRGSFGKCRFKSLKGLQFSPLCFLKHLADKVTRALHLMSMKRRPRHEQPIPAVSAANSKPLPVSAIDSHRTEAVEDCIKYINSSS